MAYKDNFKFPLQARCGPGVGRGIALLFHDRSTRRGWVVSSTPRPHFTPGKDPVPIVQEAGWAPGLVWKGRKSCPHRDLIPERPAHSQSLYRLSYPAHLKIISILKILITKSIKYNPWMLIAAQMIKKFPTLSRSCYQHQYPSSVRWIQSTLSHPIYRISTNPSTEALDAAAILNKGRKVRHRSSTNHTVFNRNIFLFLCSTQLRYICPTKCTWSQFVYFIITNYLHLHV